MNHEISVHDTADLIRSGEQPLLLDVRQPEEVAHCRIDGSLHIPIGELPSRVGDIPRDRALVVYCHHGMRSLQVATYLRANGFEKTASMRGGIDSWSREIDPRVPMY